MDVEYILDDYYGKEAFKLLHNFLIESPSNTNKFHMSIARFILKNTLSKIGTVTRSIYVTDENDMLIGIKETKGIGYNKKGKITCENTISTLNENTLIWICRRVIQNL